MSCLTMSSETDGMSLTNLQVGIYSSQNCSQVSGGSLVLVRGCPTKHNFPDLYAADMFFRAYLAMCDELAGKPIYLKTS